MPAAPFSRRAAATPVAFPLALAVAGLVAGLAAPAPVAAGTLVVANKSEATVSLVDSSSGKVVATLPVGDGPHEVAISPDGNRALIANYGRQTPGRSLTLIDVPNAKVEKTIDLEEYRRPHGVQFVAEGRALVTVEDNQSLLEVDVAAGKVGRAIPTAQNGSHMVAAAPAAQRAYVANLGSGSISAVDLATGKRIKNVPTGQGAEGIAVTPDGRQVWVTNRAADTVSVVDAGTLEVVATLPSEGFPIRAEATPDGKWVLVSNARAGDLSVFDVAGRKLDRRVPLPARKQAGAQEGRLMEGFGDSSVPIGIEIAPDGKRAYVAHANGDVISIVELGTWKVLGTLTAGKEPDGMGYSPLDVQAGARAAAPARPSSGP